MRHAEPAGEPVDPGMLTFYDTLNRACPPDFVERPLPEQRKAWDQVCRAFRAERPQGIEVDDLLVAAADHRVPVRLYRPAGAGLLPGVLYFHGGGWTLGSIETHDDMCAELAAGANVAVAAVDYRLAPEHPHPAQLEDSLAVLDWLRSEGASVGVDPKRLIAAGDSAGGQMSAGLAMWLRDQGEPQLLAQILIYPVLGADIDTDSYLRNAEAPCLTRAEMKFYLDSFLGPQSGGNWTDKYAVPLRETNYAGLPPAYITAAAHDPLHDDATLFAERLRAAGVAVDLRREPALTHSYMRARRVSEPARKGFAAIVEAVRGFAHPESAATVAEAVVPYPMLAEPGIRRFMIESDSLYPPDAANFGIPEQRAFYDRLCAHFRKPRPAGVDVEDRGVEGPAGQVPIRLYRPSGREEPPVLLYLHGGGYAVGGLDSHDDICAELAQRAGVGVVAVHYRLAPEHRFPAAFEDCLAVCRAISREGFGFDRSRLVVGGDSAGGSLTAALCLRLRDEGAPMPRGQVLIYPGLGGDRSQGSYVQHANAPGLSTADTRYFRSLYVGPEDDPGHENKFARPLKETDYSGLPPAFLVAAEWDPVRDDCYDYERALRAENIPAKVRHEPLLVHAFLRARNMSPAAGASFAAIVEAVRSLAYEGKLPE